MIGQASAQASIFAIIAAIVTILVTVYQDKVRDIGYFQAVLSKPFSVKMGSQGPNVRFRRVQQFNTDYAHATITQYESERSGMQVIVADREGPKVNGYFTLATEIFDDSGAPHTLEHLVFMGSKSYQYKGLLDKLASRAYGTTNAWTATDQTAYTLETAGWEGFAQILPVYLEHLILPTLTDAACLTEVHHINGEGNDAGVVYSEMQGVQYTSGELMDLQARRLLYPENVGFRYETGGMMEALRVLTPERIRSFHRAMYQPRNMCVIIIGEVNHDHLLNIMDQFEESVKNDIPPLNAPFKRPWIESAQPPPLKKTVVETVEFPEEDESTGDMVVGFFGPNCTNVIESTALNILLTYLSGSSVAVLENVMVEKEELASSISYLVDTRPNSVIWLQPTGVATEKLEFVEQRLISLLKEVASKPLDMAYMNECIQRERRQVKAQAEESEQYYALNIVTDYLFGNRDGSTLKELASLSEYDHLEKWTDEQWRSFLKTWISDAHHVSILGKPSLKLATKLKEDEVARIEKRKQELGAEGLEKLAKKLEDAKKQNEVEIPASLLEKWQVPPVESIHFIESQTARSGLVRKLGVHENSAQKIIDKTSSPRSPIFMQFEDVRTNFAHITVHIGTSKIPVELKPLLSIFSDNFFNTPIKCGNETLSFEQVVMELEKDTVSYSLDSGNKFGDSESILIRFQVEPEKYATTVEWIRRMMFDSIFDVTRLRAGIAKQLADVPEAKRDGRVMTSEVEIAIHNDPSSLMVAKRTLVKAVYLKRLKKLLEKDPGAVLSRFEELRKSLFTPDNLRILVTADISNSKLPDPVKTWDILSKSLNKNAEDIVPIVKPYTLLNDEGRNPGSVGATIVPMRAIDSSYAINSGKGLTSFSDPAVPALLVAMQYLETVEGTLWNAVRGNGLAYGAYFAKELDGGYLHFKVYRSPLASRAITAARDAITALVNGSVAFEKPMIEGAISQLVMGLADEQATMATAAVQNYINGVVRGLEPDYNTKMLAKVRTVTVEDIKHAMKTFLLPLFEPGKSNVVVCCAHAMTEKMEKDFQAMGYKTEIKQLSDFSGDYGLEAPEGEENGEDDEEDAEDEGSEGSEGSYDSKEEDE
ncbi:Metalloenzyme, LuxS/M16 peptidase-like protein [Annulohypoxylon truncatum]|uniref:Metalloenzyme, LuxS/M16 peptidase-like protein n=1 Tax=Annulohypoxylon truncatum TaxID=327061 RepID=UPI0020078445|nr:Metalloenzyme, LuxS/M16 peptidase-like protein [Annulohypoxylon truncatum]KAI1214774.1 Metalloenzyme, LuxS/M16 peptidase-like protein [Annulohypoxylon truncatum]